MNAKSVHAITSVTVKKHHLGKLWIVSLAALLLLSAPLIVIFPIVGFSPIQMAQAEFKNDTNPRANYWRAVREGLTGYTTVKGQETTTLIQNGGQNWRQVRNGPIATLGAWAIGIVFVLIVLFHLTIGKAKLEKRTGRKVLRWTLFERLLHWYVAILFILMALTGLSILYGRAVLIPLLGYSGFATFAQFAKPVHNYLALLFVLGLVIMLIMWFRENIFHKVDWEWIKAGGGYLKKGHAHAYKANAGEKIWFWILLIAGTALMISGIVLLFPNLGFLRETMQGADIVHGIAALILSAVVLGHIYLGTLGNEGSFEGMISGEVDEAWAKQHHDLWYQETGGKGAAANVEPEGSPRRA
jgi:formate dehydrogenase subunit gamma